MMHKYFHHIGDFMRDTSHLTPVEECFYRRAIDWYYLNEKPFPNDMKEVCRLLRAKGKIQTEAVATVFNDFFHIEDNFLKNFRCEKEITSYQSKNKSNRSNGKLGGRPKKNNDLQNHDGYCSVNDGLLNENPDETQAKGNPKPLTLNPKPILNNKYLIEISEVFEHWILVTNRKTPTRETKADIVRKSKVKKLLEDGYSVDDLKLAISNCANSNWHIENNQTDLELICRNGVNLEKFMNRKNNPIQTNQNQNGFVDFSDFETAQPQNEILVQGETHECNNDFPF